MALNPKSVPKQFYLDLPFEIQVLGSIPNPSELWLLLNKKPNFVPFSLRKQFEEQQLFYSSLQAATIGFGALINVLNRSNLTKRSNTVYRRVGIFAAPFIVLHYGLTYLVWKPYESHTGALAKKVQDKYTQFSFDRDINKFYE